MAVFNGTKLFVQLILIFLRLILIFLRRMLNSSYLLSYSLLSAGKINLDFRIFFDYISLMFRGTVVIIGTCVLIYCNWYIDNEVNFKRFFFLVLFFLMAIIFIIFIPNIFSLILG